MVEREDEARLHDQEHRAEYAERRDERKMAAQERRLEREMEDFTEAERRTERSIEEAYRSAHWGRDPERPPSWRSREPREN